MPHRRTVLAAVAALALPAFAQQPRPLRLYGKLESVSDAKLVVLDRRGERVELAIAPNLTVSESFPLPLADVKAGSFVGVGAIPQADGTQRATRVLVFPEAMRGSNEGHFPFDYQPQATMTNATVAEVAAAPDGRKLLLRYRDGEKTIVVPPETPVVSLRPADRSLLVAGGVVSVVAQSVEGVPTALRVTAGRNGFTPPY